ncbi:MAG TPA: small multi-drug export protein [Sedimentisphaerales bacterium]|nr:small multi-drug export protein [Sedimentisphaerales bacterium]
MEEKTAQSENEFNPQQKNPLKSTLLASSEGCLLLIGIALAFIYTFWLGIKLLLSPDESQVLIGMTATELMFGRAAAMAFGYSLDLGHITVISICIVIETILVLIFYPLFVFSWRHLLVVKWLKNTFERVRKSAETHKDKVQKYGVIGLFAFVWFPFWMTGPVVGSVIGFLLGLRIWLNMTVVLAGTYVAIVGWAFLLRQFHKQVASYSSYAAMVLMALLIFIIIVVHFLYRTLHENKNKT